MAIRRKDSKVCAMRGRPSHDSLSKEFLEYIQRLEPRNDGICNSITTVQKDTLYLGKVERMALMLIKEPTEEEKGAVNIIKKIEPNDADGVQDVELEDDSEENPAEKTLDDYLYTAKDGEQYGIFKLSPRECGRLMGVRDADISKMLSVNSNSQCYKQFGNSIVVPVLMGIFSQLHIKGVTTWNDLSEKERIELVERTTIDWERTNG
jgi:site-specific DNA-cytosine methylase